MAPQFGTVPQKAKLAPSPFSVAMPDSTLDEFKQLLRLSKLAPVTYESNQKERKYGLTMDWMKNATAAWEKFDWRKCEDHINSFPNFKLPVKDTDGETYDIHFVALFSEKKDAIPILFLHGWPGSFLEFLPILSLMKDEYTPATLPYHLVVPSLPGYAFSSPPPLTKNFRIDDIARLINSMMTYLGLGDGYVVQGGDIGSKVGRVLAAEYDECKAIHLNYCIMPQPKDVPLESLSEQERNGVQRATDFSIYGSAYAREHASKPSTIGFTLASSPLALLAWIGEKFLDWTDEDPPLDTILESVSLYWLTETFPRSIYPYRQLFESPNVGVHELPKWAIRNKPFGYSWFPKELAPMPKSWVETTGDLSFFRSHNSGGHFAALERPETLKADVEAFVSEAWKL